MWITWSLHKLFCTAQYVCCQLQLDAVLGGQLGHRGAHAAAGASTAGDHIHVQHPWQLDKAAGVTSTVVD